MRIEVLDHGYVEFIEAWGHGKNGEPTNMYEAAHIDYERGIIEAARQSTQGSFRGWEQDLKLLTSLFMHDPPHATPFEFTGMIIEVQAPIVVFREWHRHRTQSYNEMSARYSPLPDLYYLPLWSEVVDRTLAARTSRNRQQQAISDTERAPSDIVNEWLPKLADFYKMAEDLYQLALRIGIPKELARLSMPVGHYSRMRASANLRNWLAFLVLRTHKDAQAEIRVYADTVSRIVKQHFPHTHGLFMRALERIERIGMLETLLRMVSELCDAIDRTEEDIGGTRSPTTILGEIGPLVDKLESK